MVHLRRQITVLVGSESLEWSSFAFGTVTLLNRNINGFVVGWWMLWGRWELLPKIVTSLD
jgi:hypothetical protein